jgi:tripartite-type tricarboxylate transporter receptor subunit TctC
MRSLAGILLAAVTAGCILIPTSGPLAQANPNRTVRIVSPFAAGGSNDVIARIVAQKLGQPLGQPVIVDNRAGAGGVVGTEFSAKSAPDGYTLVMATNATFAIAAALRALPYDPVKDFAPIGLVGVSPYIVLVNPSLPVKTIRQLVALARAWPGELEFGSGGVGTPGHLAGEMLKTMTGMKMNHIPYKAGSQALTDLLGGHIAVTFSTTITSTQLIRSGRVRALAVTTRNRLAAFPDIPTVSESGVPDYEFVLWLGLAAPAGTPDAIVRQLNDALAKILQAKDLRELLIAQSVEPLSNTPQELAEKIKRDLVIYAKLVHDAGARAE